jgi:hypothetical protein
MADRVIHLYSNVCHDEAEVWCGEYAPPASAHTVDKATCEQCLWALATAGVKAKDRLLQVWKEDTSGLAVKLAEAGNEKTP